VPLGGGPVMTLADTGVVSGPAWGPDRFVYYLTASGGIRRVSADGGPTQEVVQLPPPPNGAAYRWLTVLPGGRGAIVGIRPDAASDDARYVLRVVDLKNGRLGASIPGVAARYVADAGALIYAGPDRSLMAVRFDLSSLETRGQPLAVLGGIGVRNGIVDLDAAGGTLVYALPGSNGTEHMAWITRAGGLTHAIDSTWRDTEFEAFSLSPDGKRLAITIGAGSSGTNNQSRYDIWLKTLDEGPISRLSFGGERNESPAWTHDGRHVSYTSARGGRRALWRRRADGVGEEELVADAGRDIMEARWSADGKWLVTSVNGPPSFDILVMQIGVDTVLRPLLTERHNEWKPDVSPDAKWLAYVSNESGFAQVFVRPFPDVSAGKWQISLNGGTDPLWSADGRELFFKARNGGIISADMSQGPGQAERQTLIDEATASVFETNAGDRMLAVSRDGRSFLGSVAYDTDQSGSLIIMQNFNIELRRLLAATKANR
jgi:eukaryotic-like serine/threonine-protein kinase